MNLKQQTFNEWVQRFEEQSLNMHYFSIQTKEDTYSHQFKEERTPSDVRSISKTILTIAFGRVMQLADAGKCPEINEETLVYPIIKEHIHLHHMENRAQLKKVKMKHLLTHTIGYADVLLMRDDIKDMDPFAYLDYLVNYPIVHEPGDYYLYSNAGFYLLSVVLEIFLKEDLATFLARELFTPLNIDEFHWEKYGEYLAGATRLWLLPEDLLRLGELLLHEGKVNGKQLIAKEWFEKMRIPITFTQNLDDPERSFKRDAYGYGIWLAEDGYYFGHGTDGQRLIILPERQTIILTLAHEEDTEPIDEILNNLILNK